jgi:XTP/dITP diphosphohydrolase
MELYIATGNPHKVEEMQAIFRDHSLRTPEELGLDFEYEETGTTFFDNAYGKAAELFRLSGKPVLADDSGLSLPGLGGEPGVYSARYGSEVYGEKLDAPARNRYLLSRLKGIEDRRAFFVCCMVAVLEEYRFYTVQETLHGEIVDTPSGRGGFGYDPIFYLPERERTVAQLPEGEKNRISHRGKAGAVLNRLLAELEG